MKCIRKSDQFMRVPEKMADQKIKEGWTYCKKSEFKKAENKQVIAKPREEVVRSKGRKKVHKVSAENKDPVDSLISKKN